MKLSELKAKPKDPAKAICDPCTALAIPCQHKVLPFISIAKVRKRVFMSYPDEGLVEVDPEKYPYRGGILIKDIKITPHDRHIGAVGE